MLFAIIVLLTLVYIPDKLRETPENERDKYDKIFIDIDNFTSYVSVFSFGAAALALFIPQRIRYWIIFLVFSMVLIFILILPSINSNNSEMTKKNKEKIRSDKSEFEKHIRFLVKKKYVPYLVEFVGDENQDYRELTMSKLDAMLNEDHSLFLIDSLKQKDLNILLYLLKKIGEMNIECKKTLRKLLINKNEVIRKKSSELLSKQGEPKWLEAFGDGFEISNLSKIDETKADYLLVNALFDNELAEGVTIKLCNINKQRLAKVFVKMLSSRQIKKTDQASQKIVAVTLGETGKTLLVKRVIELLNQDNLIPSVCIDVMDSFIYGLERKGDKSAINLLVLLLKLGRINSINSKNIFKILIQLGRYSELESIIDNVTLGFNDEIAIADILIERLNDFATYESSNNSDKKLFLRLYDKNQFIMINRIKLLSEAELDRIFTENDERLIPIISGNLDATSHYTRKIYAQKIIKIAKANKSKRCIPRDIYQKIIQPHNDSYTKHRDGVSSDCHEHEDQRYGHYDVGMGIDKKLLDF